MSEKTALWHTKNQMNFGITACRDIYIIISRIKWKIKTDTIISQFDGTSITNLIRLWFEPKVKWIIPFPLVLSADCPIQFFVVYRKLIYVFEKNMNVGVVGIWKQGIYFTWLNRQIKMPNVLVLSY